MSAGDFCTSGIQWTRNCERHAGRRHLCTECFHDLLRTCERSVEKRLLCFEVDFARTELHHDRNHHAGKQAGLSDVEGCVAVETAERSCDTGDGHLCAVDMYNGTETSCNLEGRFIIPAWSVSVEVGCAFRKSRSDDCALCEALGNRHSQSCVVVGTGDEPEVAIDGLAHFCCRPLAWGCGFIFGECGVCIWSAVHEGVEAGFATRFAHAEGDQTAVRQSTDPFISGLLLLAAPVVQGHDLVDIRLRMCHGHDLDHVCAVIDALLYDCLEGFERVCAFEVVV